MKPFTLWIEEEFDTWGRVPHYDVTDPSVRLMPTKDILNSLEEFNLRLMREIEKEDALYLKNLEKSVKRDGIKQPIKGRYLENNKFYVSDGLHRLIVAERLYIDKVPVKFTAKGECATMSEPLSFRRFLVEMETTPDEKDRIRTIIRKLIQDDKPWFREHEIQVGDKGAYWIINYNQGGRNEYNTLVRGMVVRKPDASWRGDELALIASFPFTRFFNKGEQEAAPIDFGASEMLEKMDGSMVGVFFPDGDPNNPQWHTRRMLSTHGPDMQMVITSFDKQNQYRFMNLIGEMVKKLKFEKTDTKMTYVFEFVHEASKVLTQYDQSQWGLYLLGARNIRTHRELTEDKLDETAKRIRSKRPRRWKTSGDQQEIQRLMDELERTTKNFEGAVFRDPKGQRVKLKRDDYVKLHHMLDKLSYKHLIPVVLNGEEDEVLAHFPEAQEMIDEFKERFQAFIEYVMERIEHWKAKKMSKRDLAFTLRGRAAKRWDKAAGGPVAKVPPAEPNGWIASKVLSYIDYDEEDARKKIEGELRELGTGKKADGSEANFNPSRLMELLGFEEDEDEEPA